MFIERRIYHLRPGMTGRWWQAQEELNGPGVLGPILETGLGYLQAIASDPERIVHFYRHASLDHWAGLYDSYYARQSPEYFARVRPMMLGQEVDILAPPPVPDLSPEGWLNLGAGLTRETELSFRPGGVPAFWEAIARLRAERSLTALWPGFGGIMTARTGLQHRVFIWQHFPDLAAAERNGPSDMGPFHEAIGGALLGQRVLKLVPADLARLRGQAGQSGAERLGAPPDT